MIKLYKRPFLLLLLFMGCLAFVLTSYWILIQGDSSMFLVFVGCIGILYFGYGMSVFAYYLIDFRAQIVMTEEYFYDRASFTKFYWGELIDCNLERLEKQKFLRLKLPKRKRNFISTAYINFKAYFGYTGTKLNISFLNVDHEKLEDFINLMNRIAPERRAETIESFKNRLH